MNPRHHGYFLSYPDIITDNSITLQGKFIFYWCYCAPPVSSHNVERICGHPIHSVISAIHHELYTFCYGAELPYDKLITNEIIEMSDVLFKLVCTIHVIIIGIVPNDDTRILYHVFNEA